MKRDYYKVIGITVDALEAAIVADSNVKDIDEASRYIQEHVKQNKEATWLLVPCSCTL